MEYRWLTNDEIEEFVNEVCSANGWARLNINEEQPTCRVLGAFNGVEMIGFIALQMMPVIGPAWTTPMHRDGIVSRALADGMHDFLREVQARGAITICESPVSERLAKRHGMQEIEFPVFQWVGV